MDSAEPQEIHFDLKSPCADCPFRRDVPCHPGVRDDLMSIWGKIEMGQFAHSCHKTDSRSDGFTAQPGTKIQHCAGALIMMKNMGPEAIQDHWILPSRWKKIKALKSHSSVFNSFNEMVVHYANNYDDVGLTHLAE